MDTLYCIFYWRKRSLNDGNDNRCRCDCIPVSKVVPWLTVIVYFDVKATRHTHSRRISYRWKNNRFRYKSNKITRSTSIKLFMSNPFFPLLEYRFFPNNWQRTKRRGIKFDRQGTFRYIFDRLDFLGSYFKLKEYTIKLSDSKFESRHSFIEEIGRTCLGASIWMASEFMNGAGTRVLGN